MLDNRNKVQLNIIEVHIQEQIGYIIPHESPSNGKTRFEDEITVSERVWSTVSINLSLTTIIVHSLKVVNQTYGLNYKTYSGF